MTGADARQEGSQGDLPTGTAAPVLRSLREITGYTLQAADGELGRRRDFLFGGQGWTVRYRLADRGRWRPGRKVLIPPIALSTPDWEARRVPVSLTKRRQGEPACKA